MSENTLNQEQQGEIRTAYRQAKHKATQVQILSDLYGVSTEVISQVIGIDDPTKKKSYSPEEKEAIVREIIDNGLSIKAAQEKYGVSWPSLKKWVSDAEKSRKDALRTDPAAEEQPQSTSPHKTIRYGNLFLDPDMCGDAADFLENAVLRAMHVDDAFNSIIYLRNILNAAFVLKQCAINNEGLYPMAALKEPNE